MKLHAPAFERALKRGWKAALRRSPELKREFRRVRRQQPRQYRLVRLVRPLVCVVTWFSVWFVAEKTGEIAPSLAVIAIAGFCLGFYGARRLLVALYSAPDLLALHLLPIRNETIFRWEFQKFVRESLWWLLDLVGGFAAVAVYFQFSRWAWLATLAICVITWMTLIAMAALGAAHFPNLPFRLGLLGLFIMPVMAINSEVFRQQFVAVMDGGAIWINLLLPSGWPVSLVQMLNAPANWSYLSVLAPMAVLAWGMKGSLARLRYNYELYEHTIPQAPDIIPASASILIAEIERPERQHLGPTEIEEMITSRTFLAEPRWHEGGRLAKALWHWLSARERRVAEFAFPAGIELVRPWRGVLVTLVVMSILLLLVNQFYPIAVGLIVGLLIFITFCQAAQQVGGGRAFELVKSSGAAIPKYVVYAIGYRELGSLLIKRTVVQIPIMLVYTVVTSMVVGHFLQASAATSLVFGVKAAGLLFASTFVFMTFGFSSGTNDTILTFRRLPFLCAMLICGIAGLVFGLAAFLSSKPLTAWVCWALLLTDAYVSFRVYGYFFHRRTFDLMRMAGA